MKKISTVIFYTGILFLFACNNKASKEVTIEDSTNTVPLSSWTSTLNDSSGKLEMKKIENVGPDSLTATSVIGYLNTQNPKIKLEYVRTSNDTIFIKIPEPEILTQQMGSTGPTMYLASVVYNLTELPGITHVNLDFEEGDHASPGTLNRESFKDE